MVTLRGRCGGAADRRRRRRRRLPAKGPETPPRPSADTRKRTPGLSNGFNADDGEHTTEEEAVKPAKRTVTRKSQRPRDPTVGRRSGLRRSTRPTKPTSRYLASKKFVGFGTDTAGPVLKRMGNMKKTRRLSKDGKIFSKAQKSRTPQRDLSDIEEEEGAATDADVRQEAAEDGVCSADPTCDAKVSRASSLYKGPSSDLLRGTFRISASGPNTTRRGAFRPTKTVWSNQSDEDDSDEEEGKVPGSCRSLGLHVPLIRKDKMAAGAGLADIDPMVVDRSVGFDSIGGLSGHISALKEMVVFPLLYPEVFDNFKIQPPRGCLFYGPPGTGKTLVARALANECSHGNRKVAFFMRKGADCLSKWVGESERQLRLLFEQAYQMRPSIIFFDEIDGLAPVRSSRQDQIHSSIVSTLLALMDGLASRGEVVVIGATNRLDSIDPALRRPGRFDREFLFGLPDRESRREILLIHTRQWKPAPSEDFVDELAEKCVGYCGADIRAVCTEAALCALRRRYPQIYGTSQKLLLDISSIAVGSRDFVAAMAKMSPAAQRSAASPAKPLSPVVQPLLGAALGHILGALHRLFPHAEQGIKRRRGEDDLTSGLLDDGEDEDSASSSILAPFDSKSKNFLHFASSAVKQPTSHRPRMLLAGRPGAGQTSHLAPAILHSLERFTVHSLDSAVLFGASCISAEEACAQLFLEARRTSPSILYVPHVHQWWDAASSALRASFLSLLGSIPSFSPILLLATCDVPHQVLDPEIQSLFREEYGEIHVIRAATKQERLVFFRDLILNQAAEAPPPIRRPRAVEVLPVAPPPPLRQPSERERLLLERREEDALRELRLFLRDVTERLSLDRRFRAFCRPVDVEEVPDYLEVVQRPMDFSTLLTNVDRHVYGTVGEFLADADLIWKNALDYNPDRDPIDRNIRHRACALKDTLQAIIRDELDEDFERFCVEIRECRNRRALSCLAPADPEEVSLFPSFSPGRRPFKKKRYKRPRKSKWSTGIIPKPKKKPPLTPSSSTSPSSSFSSSLSSSSMSSMSTSDWSSDVQPSRPNGFRRGSNGESGGGAVNGHRPRRKLRPRPHLTSKTNGVGGNKLERRSERDTSAELPDEPPRPRPVVNANRLKELLNRAVTRTDGAEVEPLEKLYALLAQCIYRHRDNYDKTELLQEMKSAINSFSCSAAGQTK